MESICKRCKYSQSCKVATTKGDEQLKVTKCSRFEERTLITNADRIRAMTDMELYKFICAHATCDRCGYASTSGYCGLLEWLKQEVDE